MTAKNAVERKNEVTLKSLHCMLRSKDGGPYSGKGGNSGCVRQGGIADSNRLIVSFSTALEGSSDTWPLASLLEGEHFEDGRFTRPDSASSLSTFSLCAS